MQKASGYGSSSLDKPDLNRNIDTHPSLTVYCIMISVIVMLIFSFDVMLASCFYESVDIAVHCNLATPCFYESVDIVVHCILKILTV